MEDLKTKISNIKSQLSVDDIVSLVCDGLGGDVKWDTSGIPKFSTAVCHGGDSYKLYYYAESQIFVCYTCCGSMDIFELVQKNKGYESFYSAYQYICKFFNICEGVSKFRGFNYETDTEFTADWDILNKVKDYQKNNKKEQQNVIINNNILEYYYKAYPEEWLREGFSTDAMDKFNIRIDPAGKGIIIPHYDVDGNLIGIRKRSYDPLELDRGMKYSPCWIGQTMYNSPLGAHLYGLDKVKNNIQKMRKVCIVESEKSCLLSETFFPGSSFTVATCGSSGLSDAQLQLLFDLQVREIIVAYDKENGESREDEETISYEEKLIRLFQPLTPYFDVYIIFDYEGVLRFKDSPFDQGKDVLLHLMKNKFKLPPVDEELLKRREKDAKNR